MDHFWQTRQKGFFPLGEFIALNDNAPLDVAITLLSQHAGQRAFVGYLIAREDGVVPTHREFTRIPVNLDDQVRQLLGTENREAVDTIVLMFPDGREDTAYRLQRLRVGSQSATAIKRDGAYLSFQEVGMVYDNGSIRPM